jgi:hypothetical protein
MRSLETDKIAQGIGWHMQKACPLNISRGKAIITILREDVAYDELGRDGRNSSVRFWNLAQNLPQQKTKKKYRKFLV